ncbi:leucine-rich repeat and calponin homology domain-containing protein 1-like isoform X2 [Centruroides sculpturatus]|uniref:leucine-rich repeat and calponin homology domain-containing protein 1-like isoform X2 n=1 Tax=Centruroides sculpturatus TaxID=218467 RepID=UPI000C6CED1B|nr:leucine-rich repeat and calponin homology domain-containing protein 1-like isoform X2 [Centruroides sculpturatus]
MSNILQIIETKLEITLPEDLSSSLMDGVLLCRLANYVSPNSVASVHVPSVSVPKLTMAKCRKNVESFLEACQSSGVPQELICSSQDVLEERGGLVRVSITVQELLKQTEQ